MAINDVEPTIRLIICPHCGSRYYLSLETICNTCLLNKCPQCNKCGCEPTNKNIEEQKLKQYEQIDLNHLEQLKKKYDLEVFVVLSPLISQEIKNTPYGRQTLSKNTIFKGKISIPLNIWGPLPKNLYKNRYEEINVLLQGIKLSKFNEETILILQRKANVIVFPNKTKNLEKILKSST